MTVPATTYPNPSEASEGSISQFLSNPAASPTGLRTDRPPVSAARRPSETRMAGARDLQSGALFSKVSATFWAASGGRRKRSGLASRLYAVGLRRFTVRRWWTRVS